MTSFNSNQESSDIELLLTSYIINLVTKPSKPSISLSF
jgi:hypothetical protein